MMAIENFINEKIKPEFQPIYKQFRALIAREFPLIKEEMRGGTESYYAIPVYRYNRIIISVSPTQKGITFSFTDGKKFEDTFSLLEGKGNKTLNLRIAKVADYSDDVFRYYINQAMEFDQ